MAFIDIKADADLMRQYESLLIDYTDNELQALKYDLAFNKLKNDLIRYLNLTDADYLDDYYLLYSETMKLALMYLQLYYYYNDTVQGEGSQNWVKMKEVFKEYSNLQAQFSSFRIADNLNVTTTRFVRG